MCQSRYRTESVPFRYFEITEFIVFLESSDRERLNRWVEPKDFIACCIQPRQLCQIVWGGVITESVYLGPNFLKDLRVAVNDIQAPGNGVSGGIIPSNQDGKDMVTDVFFLKWGPVLVGGFTEKRENIFAFYFTRSVFTNQVPKVVSQGRVVALKLGPGPYAAVVVPEDLVTQKGVLAVIEVVQEPLNIGYLAFIGKTQLSAHHHLEGDITCQVHKRYFLTVQVLVALSDGAVCHVITIGPHSLTLKVGEYEALVSLMGLSFGCEQASRSKEELKHRRVHQAELLGLERVDTLDELRVSGAHDITHSNNPHMEWVTIALSEVSHCCVRAQSNADHGDDTHEY